MVGAKKVEVAAKVDTTDVVLGDEDLFEDFSVDKTWGSGQDDEATRPLWVEDWDDQEVGGPDFQAKLRGELAKGGSAMQQ
ncbi:hypothetical protein FOA52_002537 [Chlamydomonas sp. UWO 241]|nr:hypothetical protein FOA52_002537 [Chlamydomonas sp. UWO 241]